MTARSEGFSDAAMVAALTWPVDRLEEAVFSLAQACGWTLPDAEPDFIQTRLAGEMPRRSLDQQIAESAQRWGLEIEAVAGPYGEACRLLQGLGPALLSISESTVGPHFLVLLRGDRRWIYLIGVDRSIQRFRPQLLADALWADLADPWRARVESLLDAAGVERQQRARARHTLLATLLGTTVQRGGWVLRLPPGASLYQQLKTAQVPRWLGLLLTSYAAQLGLGVGAWWLIGRDALAGEFSWAWLWAWMLLLLTTIPFQLLGSLAQRQIAVRIGEIFKSRLLQGALNLHPEEVRHQGAGHLLGRVLAADLVEQVTLAGGLITLLALFQIGAAAVILSLGAGSWLFLALLGVLLLLLAVTSWQYSHANAVFTASHRATTADLVERMVGHRTRLAQEDPFHWHTEEDWVLAHYVQPQRREDRAGNRLGLLARSWVVASLAVFVVLLAGQAPGPAQLAIALGGMLLAWQALDTLTTGIQSLARVRSAWQEVQLLFAAAQRPTATGVGLPTAPPADRAEQYPAESAPPPLLSAEAVVFRYSDRAQPILKGCHLRIEEGEQILLTGPSGGGKSTLAALLAGLRQPVAGHLALRGYDWQKVGAATWRRQVVVVPQFHENYVLTGSLAFNLLLGRCWPPTSADLQLAQEICREAGLGELLDRMPAGLNQIVGEGGWQLSHGEKSRIYLVRALLQAPQLLILDESFGALDAESLQVAMRCVRQHAATLLVIAHP